MRATAYKHHHAAFAGVVEGIDQKKVATHMALAMPRPVARQRVIKPFMWKGAIVGDKQCHYLFQPVHIVPAGMREALPILEEIFRVVGRAR